MFSKKLFIITIFGVALLVVTFLTFGFLNPLPSTNVIPNLVSQGRHFDVLIQESIIVRDSLQDCFFFVLAKETGEKYNVNQNVLYELWRKESKLNPNAKGDGKKDTNGVFIPGTWKAFGIGQIHLSTAQKHSDIAVTKDMLMDPVFNGFLSAKIFKDYLDIMGGDYVYAISAYQQGPAGALRQKKLKQIPSNWATDVYPVIQGALLKGK